MNLVERLKYLREDVILRIGFAIARIVNRTLYHSYSSKLQAEINKETLADMSRDLSLNPDNYFVPMDLVKERLRVAKIGALAYHTVRYGKSVGENVSFAEEVYKRCEGALRSDIVHKGIATFEGWRI